VTSPHISFAVADGIARLTLQRPEKRNAFTAEMWTAVMTGLGALQHEADVRVLAISGSGGSFSAGADLASVRGEDGRESPDYRRLALEGLRAVREFPRPSVAVIDGPCIGAGCLLGLACDVRFATPGSSFAIPAVRYGLEVEAEGLTRLVELVGSGQASRFLLAAATWSASEAVTHGLIEVCSAAALSEADVFLQRVASADAGAVAAARRAIREASGSGW
jgi:enoyl-CoA hydratase/carnithine racemase